MKSHSKFTFQGLALTAVLLSACAAESPAERAEHAPKGQAPAPTAAPVVTTQGHQGSTQVKPNDPDAGDTHTFHVKADGKHGTVYVSAKGMVVYVPDEGFAGGDRFEIMVADSQGVTAATMVAAAVRFAPADPTATADIVTFKNTPAAYVVFAPEGVAERFSVSKAPTHGEVEIDARGILTYTPAEGYAGADAIGVAIELMAGGTTEVTLSVNVENRIPAPSAPSLHTETGKTGTVRVASGDPDVRETFAYAIAVQPQHGLASIDAQGLLSYTPAIAAGDDLLYVGVTDGSGAAVTTAVRVVVHYPALAAQFLAEVCAAGGDRVLAAAVNPAHGELVPGPRQITATLVYSLAATTTIGLRNESAAADITAVTAGPGCGSVTVSGLLKPVAGNTNVIPFHTGAGAPLKQKYAYPSSALHRLVDIGYWADTAGGPVVDYHVAFEASRVTMYHMIAFNYGVASSMRADFAETSSAVLRMKHPNRCGLDYRVLGQSTQGLSGAIAGTFAAVNMPPAVQLSTLLTDIPVTPGKTYTLNVDLTSCGAAVAVTLATSAGWFSVSPTTVTLGVSPTPVTFEVAAALLPAGGGPVEGTLLVHPVDGSFADIEVPVSAIPFEDIDFAAYNAVGVGVQKTIDLPRPFPFGGVTHTTLMFGPEGTVCLAAYGASCVYVGLPVLGGIHELMPGAINGPVLVPYWADLQALHQQSGENASGIYWRDVSTGTDPHVEFLWWDVQSKLLPASTHNVVRMLLFDDGRFVYEYPSIQPSGLEVATWWHLLGNPGFERSGDSLKSGDRFEFGPVE